MFRLPVRDGLELRLIEERHAQEIYALVARNRQYLREWLSWADTTSGPEHVVEFIRRSLKQFADNEGFHAGIWCSERYVGGIGFHKVDWDNQRVEMGYWIGQEHQGKGLVTECSRILIDYAFSEWKLNRVEIRCAVGNVPSNSVARRLGFRLEGTLVEGQRLYGKFHDLNLYGILARDWSARAE